MNYNDFPILSNDEYNLINSHFSSQERFDRKSSLYKICNEINNCQNICYIIASKHNFKIRKALETSKATLNKLYENLSSTFNINSTQNHTFETTTLFSFINKINSTTCLVLEWTNNEEKAYYKTIAQKTTLELLNLVKQIISALEESNVFLFKHM